MIDTHFSEDWDEEDDKEIDELFELYNEFERG
jgi:hypothetical protein